MWRRCEQARSNTRTGYTVTCPIRRHHPARLGVIAPWFVAASFTSRRWLLILLTPSATALAPWTAAVCRDPPTTSSSLLDNGKSRRHIDYDKSAAGSHCSRTLGSVGSDDPLNCLVYTRCQTVSLINRRQ